MKPVMKIVIIGLTLLNLFHLTAHAQAPGEGTETHGGDVREIRLWEDAAALAQILREQAWRLSELLAAEGGREGTRFQELLGVLERAGSDGVEVRFTSRTLRQNGRRVDAINEPARRRVWIQSRRWEQLTAPEDRYALLFHEFLGALGSSADLQYEETVRLRPVLVLWAPGNCSAVCVITWPNGEIDFNGIRPLQGRFAALLESCENILPRSHMIYHGKRSSLLHSHTIESRSTGPVYRTRVGSFLGESEAATPENSCGSTTH